MSCQFSILRKGYKPDALTGLDLHRVFIGLIRLPEKETASYPIPLTG